MTVLLYRFIGYNPNLILLSLLIYKERKIIKMSNFCITKFNTFEKFINEED